jgi:hypothetical protein
VPPGTVHPRGWFEVRGSFRHLALPHPQRVRTPAAPTGRAELRDLFARRLLNDEVVKYPGTSPENWRETEAEALVGFYL